MSRYDEMRKSIESNTNTVTEDMKTGDPDPGAESAVLMCAVGLTALVDIAESLRTLADNHTTGVPR